MSAKPAGSFELHVTFSGLLLLVPVGRSELWAMMVRHPSPHAMHDHHLYVAWPPPFKPTDRFEHALADGQRITFTGAPTAADVRLLLRVVHGNLTKVHGVKAPKKSKTNGWFDPTKKLHPKLGGWVRLVNVDRISTAGGRFWRYGTESRVLLSTHVTAVVPGVPGSGISVPLADGTSRTISATAGVLKVGFFNVPASEMAHPSTGAELPDGATPPHFPAIESLLGIKPGHAPQYINPQDGSGTAPASRAQQQQAQPPQGHDHDHTATRAGGTARGINPYACLTLPLCPDDDPTCGG